VFDTRFHRGLAAQAARPTWKPDIDDPEIRDNTAAEYVREWFRTAEREDTTAAHPSVSRTSTNGGLGQTLRIARAVTRLSSGSPQLEIDEADYFAPARLEAPDAPYDGQVLNVRLRKVPGLGFCLEFKENLEHPFVTGFKGLPNGSNLATLRTSSN
jgi:hypothetical protein